MSGDTAMFQRTVMAISDVKVLSHIYTDRVEIPIIPRDRTGSHDQVRTSPLGGNFKHEYPYI
ncbi:hypothetical protein [Nitrobacter sp.]|uniref:hypothetical protein n=1 Tax=Nitrobacter sp. TaxID=29420 RepID=UPI0029CAC229|nr:hypothetical protein [Nitrobacter sp.]